jgi:hypothetical protein
VSLQAVIGRMTRYHPHTVTVGFRAIRTVLLTLIKISPEPKLSLLSIKYLDWMHVSGTMTFEDVSEDDWFCKNLLLALVSER